MASTVLCIEWMDDLVLGVGDYLRANRPDLRVRVTKPGHVHRELHDVCGLIARITREDHLPPLQALHVPIVNTSSVLADPPVPSVVFDDDQIGRLAAEHVIHRGYRFFATVSRGWEAFQDRRAQAFTEAVGGDAQTVPHFRDNSFLADENSRARVRDWLATLPRPIAVFAPTDDLAAECIAAALEQGLTIPQEIAIVGTGNTPRICDVVRPGLTSVRLPWRLLGYRAAEVLVSELQGNRTPARVTVSSDGVEVRQSTDTFSVEDDVVKRALHFIAKNVHERINVSDVLDAVPVSRRMLEVRFREQLGRTPLQEIHRQRIERALGLLVRTDLTVEAVALQSGFSNKVRFTEVFKRLVGQTPAEYRSGFDLKPRT